MAHDARAAAQRAIDLCLAEGFALAGIAPALPSDQAAHLDAWLAAGKHGSMSYLARSAATRKNALLELLTARSVVMVALQYATGVDDVYPPAASAGAAIGRIARYARGEDYHEIIKARLKRITAALAREYPGAEFRKFVDNSPFMEREHAARAGLGWVGKHTLIIHPGVGSWLALGGFLSSIDMTPAAALVPDACGTCARCIDACPTSAITPYSVDGSRCIAYLTIERRTDIPRDLAADMRDWIFGCDICQEVCPHNARRPEPGRASSLNAAPGVDRDHRERVASIPLLDLLNWQPADRATHLRETAMKRARLDMLRRNAVIALANHLRANPDAKARARLEEIASDESESPLVRTAAIQSLSN